MAYLLLTLELASFRVITESFQNQTHFTTFLVQNSNPQRFDFAIASDLLQVISSLLLFLLTKL